MERLCIWKVCSSFEGGLKKDNIKKRLGKTGRKKIKIAGGGSGGYRAIQNCFRF